MAEIFHQRTNRRTNKAILGVGFLENILVTFTSEMSWFYSPIQSKQKCLNLFHSVLALYTRSASVDIPLEEQPSSAIGDLKIQVYTFKKIFGSKNDRIICIIVA